MELVYTQREKVVGTFLIIIVFLLLFVVVMISRGQGLFRKYVSYYTTFVESYNLNSGAAVKLYKADIGKVRNISLAGDKVKVELAILEKYSHRIKVGSIATVESPTFIGDEYIAIKPGKRGEPILEPGGEIRSVGKRSLADLLSDFQVENTVKMLLQAIQDLSVIAQTFRDPEGPLFTALNNTNKILEDLTVVAEKSPETMDNVNDNLLALKRILSDVEVNIAILKDTLTNIEKGSQDIPKVMKVTKKSIREARQELENVDKIIHSLKENFLIKGNLPPEPDGEAVDAGLRE